MIHPPVVRGGPVARWAALVFGLFLFALGIVLLLESGLGLSPWDVLNQGISDRTALSFGTANIVVALLVLVLGWALGARIGPGTIANALLIGLMVDALLAIDRLEALDGGPLGCESRCSSSGIGVIASAAGFYIGADLGAGPRDSLMLVLARRSGVRIGIVRGALEAAATVLGFALGGTVGIGTLAFVFGIGPAVEVAFASPGSCARPGA